MLTFLNDIIKQYKIGYQFRSLGQEILPFLVLVCPSSWQWLQVRFLFRLLPVSDAVWVPGIGSDGQGQVRSALSDDIHNGRISS